MKEISIEEKAKAYDEAIKKAETLYKASEPMSGCNVLLETLFPGLKESEDEKIRKELLQIAKKSEDSFYMVMTPDKRKHLITWLEKQGEQKPADSYCQKNCKGFQETGKCFADGDCKAKREAEQKPADWSEEDDYNLQCCIAKVQNDIDNGRIGRNRELLTWLKSLRTRSQWKPSDGQMEALDDAIAIC